MDSNFSPPIEALPVQDLVLCVPTFWTNLGLFLRKALELNSYFYWFRRTQFRSLQLLILERIWHVIRTTSSRQSRASSSLHFFRCGPFLIRVENLARALHEGEDLKTCISLFCYHYCFTVSPHIPWQSDCDIFFCVMCDCDSVTVTICDNDDKLWLLWLPTGPDLLLSGLVIMTTNNWF